MNWFAVIGIAFALCVPSASGECTATEPIPRGICERMKECMCGDSADYRLKVVSMSNAMRCDGPAKRQDFQKPPRFSYHLAKSVGCVFFSMDYDRKR